MSGHQSTADMVNNELDQFQDTMNPSIDMLMAEMNPNPDLSEAQDIHGSLENNGRILKCKPPKKLDGGFFLVFSLIKSRWTENS